MSMKWDIEHTNNYKIQYEILSLDTNTSYQITHNNNSIVSSVLTKKHTKTTGDIFLVVSGWRDVMPCPVWYCFVMYGPK